MVWAEAQNLSNVQPGVIYASVSLIHLPCLEVFFFTEILHSAGVQEVCGKMQVQQPYRNVGKEKDFKIPV